MARFYADENFPREVAEILRGLGHDVLTAQEAGQANLRVPDPHVFSFAASQQRVVLTFDRQDFMRLHRHAPSHCGIVVCRYDPDFEGLALRIHESMRGGALAGALVRINRPQR